ncbi:MAG: hydroxymethylglutaryl-CoA reductase, degradative [Deltaproteobacteria bacterium]|nr:hydroxymethylglutaryl-CoA reductase, degradative [Deltaproteobacteria bacterium]
MEHQTGSSRLPGFFSLPARERMSVTARFADLNDQEATALHSYGALSQELTDIFIENSIGTFSLPLGIATNFKVNGRDVLVPMAVEESSVLAAASHGAKLARIGGGFLASSTEPIMTGQIQIYPESMQDFEEPLQSNTEKILEYANRGQERLLKRGGGAKDLDWYTIPEIGSVVINLHIHTCDAMGANIVNTMVEKVSHYIERLLPVREMGLRILSNLTAKRRAKAECIIPPRAFSSDRSEGEFAIRRIFQAWQFAWYDINRAATHNKGVMNGIDPVLIATGNDWRAAEAGAHAWCSREGHYRPMTRWSILSDGQLHGSLEIPMALGTVGGVTKLHPTAQAALKLMNNPDARTLAEIVCSVGLAQNLSALRALASEGIQKGHMALHQKNISLRDRVSGATIQRSLTIN